MKRSASDRRKSNEGREAITQRQRSVKWDEANLEENTKIQAELNPRKINEPKTPYHGPMDSEDEDLEGADMAPLNLEDDVRLWAHTDHSKQDCVIQNGQVAMEQLADERNGTSIGSRDDERSNSYSAYSDSERGEQSSGAQSNSFGSHSAVSTSHSSGDGVANGEDCENGATSKRAKDRHRKFEARRKQHYNMREALRKGKEMLEHDAESTENPHNVNGVRK